VFAFVADQRNEPQWHTDVLAIRPAAESVSGLGSTWLVTVKFMGRKEYMVKVTGFEPNRRVEFTTMQGPMKPTTTYLVEPADGGTRFTRHVDIPIHGPIRIMKPLIRRMAQKRNAGFVEKLKNLLEQ
jgi:Polyketide cyclase / dehydrase and lipid transport